MGTYYAAYDGNKDEVIHPLGNEANKFPWFMSPGNKFCAVVMFANMQGGAFEIVNDSDDHEACHSTDVTEKYYKEYDKLMGYNNDNLYALRASLDELNTIEMRYGHIGEIKSLVENIEARLHNVVSYIRELGHREKAHTSPNDNPT